MDGHNLSQRPRPQELAEHEDGGLSVPGRWVNSHDLFAGDLLLTQDGRQLRVLSVSQRYEESFTVCNLTIDTNHSFAVGNDGLLVHNTTGCGKWGINGPNGGLGKLVKVNSPDPAADALAKRLGGESRVRFSNGPDNEFDAVSDLYVAQSKPANFVINKKFRDQAKATFEAAIQSGRKPYFHFEGAPHRDVLRKLEEYGKRYGVEPVIDITPFN